MPEQTGLDLGALRRLATTADWDSYDVGTAYAQMRFVLAALERADEVAGQGCEYCGAMVTDRGPEDEAHGHWWQCGECANKGAIETSTIIWHLSDLLRLALEATDG